jgi:hypothetical protein
MEFSKKTLIKQKKVVLNKAHRGQIDVAIGEIHRVDNQVYYVISFGGDKQTIIVGADEYEKFIDLVINLDWDPEDTWIRPIAKNKKHTCRFD